MEMIQSLGINSTAIIQFGIFIFTFFFLRHYVFSAYHAALLKRLEKTKGGEEIANEYAEKTSELHSQYQDEARKVHHEISTIYQHHRNEAMADADKLVTLARLEAQKMIEAARVTMAQSVATAAQSLKSQTSGVALSITNKLLGK